MAIYGKLSYRYKENTEYTLKDIEIKINKDSNNLRGLGQVYNNKNDFLIIREGIEDFNGEDLDIFLMNQEICG